MADKDFIVKNGLVVGDTLTIAGVELDLSNATSGQVLKFDGSKFEPAAEGDISGTSYSVTIGDGSSTNFTISHGFGTRNVILIVRNANSPYESVNVRWEATTTNSITLDFSAPPDSDSLVATVYSTVTGISTGSSVFQTVGDGSTSSFTVNHGFNTRDVILFARNANSPYENIDVRWEATSANTVTVDFSSAPESNSVRLGVYGTVSGTEIASTNQVPEGNSNLYFSNTRARAAISVSGDLAYNTSTGVISLTSGSGDIESVTAGIGLTGGGTSGSVTLNLANTAVSAGTYGSSGSVASFTVDAQGRLTNASNTAISIQSTAITDFTEATQDASATMFTSGSHSGIAATYDDANAKVNLNVADFTLTLAGDLTGNVTVTDLANATLTATIAADSVALGTKTTGNYVASLVAGTGVTLSNNSGETATPTIAIGQAVATNSNVTFNDVTVSGNLTVSGTTTSVNTETLTIDDNIIVLNNNVTAAPSENAGIEIERGSSTNVALRWNETNDKWESTNDGTTYGNLVTTADSGTVTSTMIADGTIVNADINTSAAIALSKLASGSSAQVVIANATGVPTYVTLSGDVTVTNAGVVSIAADSVALGTDTTGNYVASLAAGTGVTLANNSGEGATPTVSIGQSVATNANVTFNDVTVSGALAVTGTITLPSTTSIGNVSNTEISYLDGVTSAIQTQINTKASTGKAIAMAIVFGG